MEQVAPAEPAVPPHVARFRLLAPDPLTAEELAHIRRLLGPAPQTARHPQRATSAVRRPAVIAGALERKAS